MDAETKKHRQAQMYKDRHTARFPTYSRTPQDLSTQTLPAHTDAHPHRDPQSPQSSLYVQGQPTVTWVYSEAHAEGGKHTD